MSWVKTIADTFVNLDFIESIDIVHEDDGYWVVANNLSEVENFSEDGHIFQGHYLHCEEDFEECCKWLKDFAKKYLEEDLELKKSYKSLIHKLEKDFCKEILNALKPLAEIKSGTTSISRNFQKLFEEKKDNKEKINKT